MMKIVVIYIEESPRDLSHKDYIFIFTNSIEKLINIACSYRIKEDEVYCLFSFIYFDYLRKLLDIKEISYIYNTHVDSLMPKYVVCKIINKE